MDTLGIIKHFFTRYGKVVTDARGVKKTFGVIISKNTANQEVNNFFHTDVGFVSKNKTVLLTLINDFIKVNDVVLVDGVKYKIIFCEEFSYLKKSLYMRCIATKMELGLKTEVAQC